MNLANVIEGTLMTKEFVYHRNNSLIKVKDEIELSSSNISILFSHGEFETIEEYHAKTKLIGKCKGLYDLPGEVVTTRRSIDFEKFGIDRLLKITPDQIDTKEYWNFLHKEFQYCDVMSYPIVPNLVNYFGTKIPLYEAKIDHLPGKLQFFKDKKVLEIGGGYGCLPRLLSENKINHKYYHADIVKRFDCDNFIDLDGYHLVPSISEGFDVIVMFDVFQHLNITTINSYFNELKYFLNDGGHILISTPFLDKEYRALGTFFAQTYVNPSEKEFFELLNRNNYSWQKIDYYCRTKLEGCFYIIKMNETE
jgi:hypothetical protein